MLGSTVRRRALSSCAAGLAGRRGPEEIGAIPPGGEVDVADIERDGGEPSGLEGRGGGAVALDAGDLSQDSAMEAEGGASRLRRRVRGRSRQVAGSAFGAHPVADALAQRAGGGYFPWTRIRHADGRRQCNRGAPR